MYHYILSMQCTLACVCIYLWKSWWRCRYALLGAASFLGGSMRMTVSLCVIMVEITNNLKLLPLIMLVLLISKVWLSKV